MKPDIKRGEAFMKAVVKASLGALFAIGIKSPEIIDRFIISFTENFEKYMQTLQVPTQSQPAAGQAPIEAGSKPVKKGKKK